MRLREILVSVAVLVLGLAACGGADEVTIDSGQPQARPTTTTSTTQPEDNDDDDDDRGHGRNDEEISCDDEPSPSFGQIGGKLEVTGNCDTVTVKGIDLRMKIESTEHLVVRGTGNEVEVTDSLGTGEVHGLNHDIKVPDSDDIDNIDNQSPSSDIHD